MSEQKALYIVVGEEMYDCDIETTIHHFEWLVGILKSPKHPYLIARWDGLNRGFSVLGYETDPVTEAMADLESEPND